MERESNFAGAGAGASAGAGAGAAAGAIPRRARSSFPFSLSPPAFARASVTFPAVKAAEASSHDFERPARPSLAWATFAASIPFGSFFALPSSATFVVSWPSVCGSEAARSFHAFVSSSFFAAVAFASSVALLASSVPAARASLYSPLANLSLAAASAAWVSFSFSGTYLPASSETAWIACSAALMAASAGALSEEQAKRLAASRAHAARATVFFMRGLLSVLSRFEERGTDSLFLFRLNGSP